MDLPKVTVEIQYRYDAGTCTYCKGAPLGIEVCPRCHDTFIEPPSSKQLLARVRQQNAEGFTFGVNLLGKRYVTSVLSAKQICRSALQNRASEITFILQDGLNS